MHDFSATIPRCYKDVYVNSSFPCMAKLWNSLPIECFPSIVVAFLVTPCLVVAVQPCMEWIPIKKKQQQKTLYSCISDRITRAFNRSGATWAVALDILKAFDRSFSLLLKPNPGQIFGLISFVFSNSWFKWFRRGSLCKNDSHLSKKKKLFASFIALQKWWKMFFISSLKFFSLLRGIVR